MKKIVYSLTLVSLFLTGNILAQDLKSLKKTNVHQDTRWYTLMNSDQPNYLEVIEAFESYFKSHPHVKSIEELEYKRWLKKVGSNFDANGNILEVPDFPLESSQLVAKKSAGSSVSGWTVIGPTEIDWEAPMGSSHTTQGVIRSVTQDPVNPEKIFLGSVSAGIWLSLDNGASWDNVGTNLLFDHVKGITVAPSDTDVVYAATSAGPVKSIDGGLVWNYTGLNESGRYPSGHDPFAMLVDENDADVAVFASDEGLWISRDGGETWVRKLSDHIWDVAYRPGSSTIMYASAGRGVNNYFMRSDDAGETWAKIISGYSSSNVKRLCVAVTPAAPDHVYLYAADGNDARGYIYKSVNAGLDFTKIVSPNMLPYDQSGNEDGLGQATWDMDLAVSTTDTSYILAGGIFVWKTEDGGETWTAIDPGHPQSSPHWYHWDCQGLEIFGEKAWMVNDGGVFLSDDRLGTTSNKSMGIYAQEIWGFDQGWKSDVMAIGLYHGPVQIRDDETYDGWYIAPGADAGTVQVNKGDDNFIYAHPWDDVKITRSGDRMTRPRSVDLNAALPFYIYPIEIADHAYYNTFYTIDEKEVKRTTNNAASWVSMFEFPGILRRITTSYSKRQVVYVIQSYKDIWKTEDGGIHWEKVTPSSDLSSGYSFSNITIDGENENVVWASMGAKQEIVKVLKSTDGGSTWSDYSKGLPSHAVNSIVNQLGTDGGVYAATDAGVYYRNNSMDSWLDFSQGLPAATRVYFIRINYAKEKIRIGTLRGVWEGDFYEQSSLVVSPIVEKKGVEVGGSLQFFDHSSSLENATYSWTFPGGSPGSSSEENPLIAYDTMGTYGVSLEVSDERGTVIRNIEHYIVVGDTTAPTQPENFTASEITGTSLKLSWDHAVDNVDVIGYNLWLGNIKLKSVKATSYELTGLTSGESYSFYLTAYDEMGNQSQASSVLDITMPEGGINDPISQARWSVLAVSSQETASEDGKASNAIDGNTETIWHTEWSLNEPVHPHTFDIDLGEVYVLTEFSYLPRQIGVNGRIKDFEIYVSSDGTGWGSPVATGSWSNTEAEQKIIIQKAVGRYVRLKVLSEVNGGAWTSAAEFRMRGGVYTSIDKVLAPSTGMNCKIYPNPSDGAVLNIEVENTKGRVSATIYTMTGTMLKAFDMNTDGARTVSVSDFKPGIYLVVVKDQVHSEVRKLLIKLGD
jgi:photosystem II stability/assembly factor-like uncharacterized protein/PKD repeat protein